MSELQDQPHPLLVAPAGEKEFMPCLDSLDYTNRVYYPFYLLWYFMLQSDHCTLSGESGKFMG